MEKLNYRELVQKILKTRTENYSQRDTETHLIFDQERDGTEIGVANELVEAGVPKTDIVLAFYAPYRRQYTEFAVG